MQAYGLTDVGRIRSCNQDYLYSSLGTIGRFQNLFLVADGMGGHQAGDYASRFAVESLVAYFEQNQEGPLISELQNGIQWVNEVLYRKSMEEPSLRGMGTTLVAATIDEDTLYVANVGDSRLYLYRSGRLIQVTKDHSYVEEMVALGKIERNSENYRKNKNIITRAIGAEPKVRVDFFEETLMAGDFILMCSDGLSNMMSEQEITECLRQEDSLEQKVQKLINTANRNGGRDNIATVLVEPQISEVKPC